MKRFFRSSTDKAIAGVCGGIAEYFGIDPVLVRVIAILLFFATGFFPTGVAYLLFWWLVPERA